MKKLPKKFAIFLKIAKNRGLAFPEGQARVFFTVPYLVYFLFTLLSLLLILVTITLRRNTSSAGGCGRNVRYKPRQNNNNETSMGWLVYWWGTTVHQDSNNYKTTRTGCVGHTIGSWPSFTIRCMRIKNRQVKNVFSGEKKKNFLFFKFLCPGPPN